MLDKVNNANSTRYEFGYYLMGPVIAEYLMKLHGTINFFDKVRDAKILFVSRAGIRIRRALETYLKTVSVKPQKNWSNFWISRLMVAKGIWRHNKGASIALLSNEFYHAPIRNLAYAMFHHDGLPADFPIKHESLDLQGSELAVFFKKNGPAANALSSYFDQQGELFETYLDGLMGLRKSALLIDTGWAGTAQRLLADAFTDIEWWGAYFGRYGFSHTDRKYWRNMIGLEFEQDDYQFSKPETCTILHRHMIEDLFEPSGESIERLIEDSEGRIEAPEAKDVLADRPKKNSDPRFTGVLDYLSKLPDGNTPALLHKNARKAWREISRIVVLPTQEETVIFSDILRSADFGKVLKVPLLLPTKKRHHDDTLEKRINAALWQAGQSALEYPKEIAEPLQRKLAGLSRFNFKQPEKKIALKFKKLTRPAVAVITRSLDRTMFLRRALKSVADQTFTDYVHVVVNDGGDIELAKKTIAEADCFHHKIVLVDNIVNRGMEAASNIAIRAVDSDFIVIHDDDDSWGPEFLEKTVTFLDGNKRRTYDGVISKSTYVSEEVTPEGIVIHSRTPYQEWVENVHFMEMAIGNFFPPIAFLFRRDIYDQIGGFNEDFPVLGDWDFNLRFLSKSNIGVLNLPLANYHHRDRGDTSLFGNSVISGRDKHLEYSAVVRNMLTRNLNQSGHPALAVLVGMGLHVGSDRSAIIENKTQINDMTQKMEEMTRKMEEMARKLTIDAGQQQHHTGATSQQNSDDYWVAKSRYKQAIALNDKQVLHAIGVNVSTGLKALMGGRVRNHLNGESMLSWRAIQYLIEFDKKGYNLEAPPDFDEERYLAANPDVAQAVGKGHLSSGFEHYYRTGCYEGRQRPAKTL